MYHEEIKKKERKTNEKNKDKFEVRAYQEIAAAIKDGIT